MVTIENVTKCFGKKRALDNINCTIKDGSILGVVGSNGAGKSTLLRLISGVYKADKGSIKIDGESIYDNAPVKHKCVFISDNPYYYQGATLDSMAKLYSSFYRDFSFKEYDELVEIFGLDPQSLISIFSKGMQRQAIIILALSCKCKYIILDEALDGLDPVKRGIVKQKLYNSVMDNESTVIISSHSLRELEDTCDNLVMIHDGKVIFERDVADMETMLSKVQIVLQDDLLKSDFEDIEVLKYTRNGSVANLIVKGDSEKILKILDKKNPILIEVLPLSLEEIFTYELHARGYGIDVKESEGARYDQ
jgi:ABC-2 type transport system ATP-binding protein